MIVMGSGIARGRVRTTAATVESRKMIFLTSELANKAEIAILSARDTTRAWVPGRGIMGRNGI